MLPIKLGVSQLGFTAVLIFILASCQPDRPITFSMEQQSSGTNALIVSISILDDQEVWMSGTQSTVLKSSDGGISWDLFKHPEIDTFQFRDIHAFTDKEAIVLSIGEGRNSQIHKFSTDAGWERVFIMDHPEGFLNSIDFWNDNMGLAYGDSFDGKPFILKTENGGATWFRIQSEQLPDAPLGEGGFASSGSCIALRAGGAAWIGTGAGGSARVLKTTDFGNSWTAHESPIVKGDAAGITSIHFQDDQLGFIAGGDLSVTDAYSDNLAYSVNAGLTWTLTQEPITLGAFYGSDLTKFRNKVISVICGPNGADISFDQGVSWTNITQDNLWVVDLDQSGFGWLAGREGVIYRILFQ